jgi:hypothetical protein
MIATKDNFDVFVLKSKTTCFTGYCNSFSFSLWLYNYWEYGIEFLFAVEGHIILKTWLILRILKMSSCGSLSTSNIGYEVIKKKKMSCNTRCPCISSVWERYSKILHNMHFDHVIWHHNAFCHVWQTNENMLVERTHTG